MRFLLQFYDDVQMLKRTLKLEVPPDIVSCGELLALVGKRLNKPQQEIIARVKRGGRFTRLVDQWPLMFYELDEGSIVNLEFIQDYELAMNYQANISQKQKMLMRNNIAKKSLMISKIEEKEEDQDQAEHEFNLETYFDSELNQALQVARRGDMHRFQEIAERVSEQASFQQDFQIRRDKMGFLLSHIGPHGWSAVHQGSFANHLEFLIFLIEQGANPSIKTGFGETALTIAAKKGHKEIVEMLCFVDMACVNQLTNQGTALHVAAKHNHLHIIQILLQYGADRALSDSKGNKPLDLCSSKQCLQLLSQQALHKLAPSAQVDHSRLPIMVRGTVFKLTFTHQLQQRFLILNPADGTIIRFESQKDYPLYPIEVTKLAVVNSCKMIDNSSIFSRRGYHYFQLDCHKKLVFASRHVHLVEKWCFIINKAVKYNKDQNSVPNEAELSLFIVNQAQGTFSEKEKIVAAKTQKEQFYDKLERLKLLIKGKASQKKQYLLRPVPSTITVSGKASSYQKQGSTQSKVQSQESIQDRKQQNYVRKSGPDHELVRKKFAKFSDFDIIRLVGSGAFGKVFLTRNRDSGKQYAMKVLNKRTLLKRHHLKYAVSECNILKQVDSNFLIKLHYAFQTPNNLYFVLDYCRKGDISYFLAVKEKFTEAETRFYIAELVLAIQHLHKLNIFYRDLKPVNMLIGEDGHMRLTDFGLSKEKVLGDSKTMSFCGTPVYLSPDMLSLKGAGKEADLYGIGVVMYEFLHGNPPFYSEDEEELKENIRYSKLRFDKSITATARDLITRLLDRNPKKRIGVKSKEEIKEHLFFKGLDWKALEEMSLEAPFKNEDCQDYEQPRKTKFTDIDYGEDNAKANRVINFSFSRH